MKKQFVLYILLLWSVASFGQFVSEGTTVIRDGATFHSEHDVEIGEESILRNKGTISVDQDLNNHGFIQSARESTVSFSGMLSARFLPGDANYNTILLGKFNNDITLDGNLTIDHRLEFTGNNTKLILDRAHLTIMDTASIINYGPQKYIVTNDTGSVIKELNLPYLTEFPVGTSNGYTPLIADLTGTVWTVGEQPRLKVRVVDEAHPDLLSTSTSYINRYWEVHGENIVEYENVLTGTFLATDVVGSMAAVKGSTHDESGWHFYASQGSALTISDRINELEGDFTGQDYHGILDVSVNIQGAYDDVTGLMLTQLNDKGFLPGETPTVGGVTPTPAGHPYQVAPWNFADITLDTLGDGTGKIPYASDVVDYVLVSVLEGGNNVSQDVVFTSVGLLKSDGSIQIADELKYVNLTSQDLYYVLVEHRNHLPVLDTLNNFNGVLSHDFSTEDSYVQSQGGTAVGQVKLGNVYMMAAGNGAQGQTPSARYFISSTDQFIWKVGQNSEGYHLGDHNMNGDVSSLDEFIWNINQNFESQIPR